MDAHKERAAKDGSTGRQRVVCGNDFTLREWQSERGWYRQGSRGAWRCVVVLAHTGQGTANGAGLC